MYHIIANSNKKNAKKLIKNIKKIIHKVQKIKKRNKCKCVDIMINIIQQNTLNKYMILLHQ